MNDNHFAKVMSQRTDLELYKIVTDLKDDYQPEAVTAAQIELEKRNLSGKPIPKDKIEKTLGEEEPVIYEKQTAKEKAEESLSVIWKVLTFLKPGFIQFFISYFLRTRGYYRKAKELSAWTLYGFAAYMIIVFVILFVNKYS